MTDASTQLLELRECAYRLGLVFGAEAEGALTTAQRVAAYELFNRCFFSVRVAIALDLRLRQEARRGADGTARPEGPECEAPEHEGPERERPEREPPEQERYDERDRDREVERASFPLLLRTLEGVVADAEACLPGPPPAELPTLRELLSRVTAPSGERSPHRAPAPAALRARLAGSAAPTPASSAPVSSSPSTPPRTPPADPSRRWPTGPPG